MNKESKKKLNTKLWLEIIAIIFAFAALIVSCRSCAIANKSLDMAERESAPNIKIIQNLWSKEPRFELVNESNSKLDNTPSPSYLIFIPSKVFYVIDGKVEFSSLVLSPVSYEVIEEQRKNNQTNESIVTSYLPKSFFAKTGDRDVINSEIMPLTDELEIYVSTLPFLVIFSDVEYKYNEVSYRKIILSTPQGESEMSEEDLHSIYDYVIDTSRYLEVKTVDDGHSAYQIAHNNVEELIKQIFIEETVINQDLTSIIGGNEGGYNSVLKRVNELVSPTDPIAEYNSNKE